MKPPGHRRSLTLALAAMTVLAPAPAFAQTPPGSAEIAAYRGFHAAAATGDLGPLRRLRDRDIDAWRPLLQARDGNGRTPLHVATFMRQRAALELLLAGGADTSALDADRYDAVTIAAVADDEETLAMLLTSGASSKLVTSRWDGTALIAAAHLGHAGVVRRLIAAGAPLDHVNNLGWTALIEAIVLGDGGPRHQATVRALLDAHASTILADRSGRTPLALARARGYDAIVAMLESAGAR